MENEERNECCICYNTNILKPIPCTNKHSVLICSECIDDLYQSNPICPVCRHALDTIVNPPSNTDSDSNVFYQFNDYILSKLEHYHVESQFIIQITFCIMLLVLLLGLIISILLILLGLIILPIRHICKFINSHEDPGKIIALSIMILALGLFYMQYVSMLVF